MTLKIRNKIPVFEVYSINSSEQCVSIGLNFPQVHEKVGEIKCVSIGLNFPQVHEKVGKLNIF